MKSIHYLLSTLSVFLFLLSPNLTFAQERCGTVEYEKFIHRQSSGSAQDQLENWIKGKLRSVSKDQAGEQRTESNSYIVPVVVHVIHNGEAVGSGTNIPDDQIKSQITVLNNDYKRLNADASNTPPDFAPFASSIDITFVLAQQDPDGASTTGITRTKGTKTSWVISDNTPLKSLSYWPAENYLNIWVTDLSDASGLIGYAQLPISPTSNPVDGLENSSQDRLTDGVVIDYKAFGTGAQFNLSTQFNLGRSATHEIGHFFGLRHVWGDGTCATDYVDDTPFQTTSTNGCPTTPQASCETASVIAATPYKAHFMFQDYMDYTNDACMNLFTKGQTDRMNIIINNSPRRLSLLSSPGKDAPVLAANDLAIHQIISPLSTNCESSLVTPQIDIRNTGTNNITSAQIQLTVNGNAQPPVSFSTLNLTPQQSTTVSFPPIALTPATANQIVSFQILQVNEATDGKPANNTMSVQVTVPINLALPFAEPFNSVPAGWSIFNPDGSITWANITAPDASAANKAMYMNFYEYDDPGAVDWLSTPYFTTNTPATTQLRFDLSYAQYTGETGDNLKIYAVPGCTADLTKGLLLYNKSSVDLATATSTTSSYVPTSNAQWRKSELISLNNLTPGTNWQLIFVATNSFGNNLYIDNVVVTDKAINDLALTSILTPGLVSCEPSPVIQFSVKNLGTSTITSFQVQRTLNGGNAATQSYTGISIAVGEERLFSLSAVSLSPGSNQISLAILSPNGIADTAPENNSINFRTYLDQTTDIVPLRKTFDNASESSWLLASPLNFQLWSTVKTNKNLSLVYRSFSNTGTSEEAWVVSPTLDFTSTSKNGLFFDISYALRGTAVDRLKVLASTDCGFTYNTVLFDKAGTEFKSTTTGSEWIPSSDTDWKNQFISLDAFSGKKNVRLAFVASNKNGNDLYLDNIEVFADDDSRAIRLAYPYQLYYSTRNTLSDVALSFNLPDRKDVKLQVFSLMGQIIIDNVLPSTLNQTYYFDLALQSQGLYIFRLQIDDQITTTKVFIGH